MPNELIVPGRDGLLLPGSDSSAAYRDMLLSLPREEREKMKPFLAGLVAHWEPIDRHFPAFLQQYIPSLPPHATIVVLASGLGGELLQIRKHLPESRIVAFDKEVLEQTVAAEILSDAEFYERDLTVCTPEDILGIVGTIPDLVLCRHPNVTRDTWWPENLTIWGKLVREKGSTLLITTYEITEQEKIVKALRSGGLTPELSSYREALRVPSAHNPDLRADKFVTIVRP